MGVSAAAVRCRASGTRGAPGAQRGFAGRDGLRFGRGIAQLLQDTARPLGAAVGEQGRGGAEGGATEITVHPVTLDSIQERGHLDQFRAHGDETEVDDLPGPRSGSDGGRFFLAGRGQGESRN